MWERAWRLTVWQLDVPLVVHKNIFYYSSIRYAGFRRYIPKPVTTPSANKNFSWYKTQMIQELFELFNSTLFFYMCVTWYGYGYVQ